MKKALRGFFIYLPAIILIAGRRQIIPHNLGPRQDFY